MCEREWDFFICHASEDKKEIAKPLAEELEELGLDVWYDEFTLKVGDKLRRAINEGLSNSRYGIVILSPSFFEKEWPQRELDGLTQKDIDGEKVILPVWHDVSREDVKDYSPPLADRVAAKTSEDEIDTIAEKILDSASFDLDTLKENRVKKIIDSDSNDKSKLFKYADFLGSSIDDHSDLNQQIATGSDGTKYKIKQKSQDHPNIKANIQAECVEENGTKKTFLQKIKESVETRRPFEVNGDDINKFSLTYKDEDLLEDLIKDWELKSMSIEPEPFPEPIPCKIIANSENSFDYVPLGTESIDIDGKEIVLTSGDEIEPYFFKFKISYLQEKINLNFSIDNSKANVKEALKFEKFLKSLVEGKTLKVKNLKKNNTLFEGELGETDLKSNEGWLEILESLNFIQEETDAEFSLPEEITNEQVVTIQKVRHILEEGELEEKIESTSIELEKDKLKTFFNSFQEDGKLIGAKIDFVLTVNLFGEEINLGQCERRLPPLKLSDNKEDILEKADKSDSDTIKITLLPEEENSSKIIFKDWG